MRPVAIALLSISLLVLPVAANAETYLPFMTGSGGMMLNGATYSGTILAGMTGTWSLEFDDSLWPDDADSTARFDYIWTNFFEPNYNSSTGQEGWFGYFNSGTLPTAPVYSFFTSVPGGDLVTSASVTILVRDWYADGILSQSEKHHNCQVSMTLSVETPLCTGYFEDFCGTGSLGNGNNFNFVNPPTADDITFNGQLEVWFCGAPVEGSTWGAMKALYR